MAKRKRDYKAEYAARKAREQARGFASPRQATKARTQASRNNANARYLSEARRVSPSMRKDLKFREERAGDAAYVKGYHEMLQGSAPLEWWADQYGTELTDWDEFRSRYKEN